MIDEDVRWHPRTARAAGMTHTWVTSWTAKTGLPFTIEEVCRRADVGKTFIYDKKRPELTKLVLDAGDISRQTTTRQIDRADDANEASWRERALNAEGHLKHLRAQIREQDGRITDLTGQLFDPEGNHLADENARLRSQIDALNLQLTTTRSECSTLQRSLPSLQVCRQTGTRTQCHPCLPAVAAVRTVRA